VQTLCLSRSDAELDCRKSLGASHFFTAVYLFSFWRPDSVAEQKIWFGFVFVVDFKVSQRTLRLGFPPILTNRFLKGSEVAASYSWYKSPFRTLSVSRLEANILEPSVQHGVSPLSSALLLAVSLSFEPKYFSEAATNNQSFRCLDRPRFLAMVLLVSSRSLLHATRWLINI
jgi:hypothetical protein